MMFDRTTNGWKVTLGNQVTGATVELEIHNHWDPARVDTSELVGQAAVAEAFLATRQQHVPVAVERL